MFITVICVCWIFSGCLKPKSERFWDWFLLLCFMFYSIFTFENRCYSFSSKFNIQVYTFSKGAFFKIFKCLFTAILHSVVFSFKVWKKVINIVWKWLLRQVTSVIFMVLANTLRCMEHDGCNDYMYTVCILYLSHGTNTCMFLWSVFHPIVVQ